MKHIRDCIRAFLVKRYGLEYWKRLRSQPPPKPERKKGGETGSRTRLYGE